MSGGIGILGGTFDPIHLSHLYLAEEAKSGLNLDRILIIPTWLPPHKRPVGLAPAEDRAAMCHLAIENREGFSLCDYEIRRQGLSYTVRTLEYLHGEYPGERLWLIVGADMFLTLQEWREPEEIFRLASICAAARNDGEIQDIQKHRPVLEQMGARCHILPIPPRAASSTGIRETIARGGDPSQNLPAGVWNYIREHRLYGAKGEGE